MTGMVLAGWGPLRQHLRRAPSPPARMPPLALLEPGCCSHPCSHPDQPPQAPSLGACRLSLATPPHSHEPQVSPGSAGPLALTRLAGFTPCLFLPICRLFTM